MNRHGKEKTTIVLVTLLVVAVLGLLAYTAGVPPFDSTGSTRGQQTAVVGQVLNAPVVCESGTSPDIDIDSFDVANPGTALTESTNLYRKQGSTAWTAWTAGT